MKAKRLREVGSDEHFRFVADAPDDHLCCVTGQRDGQWIAVRAAVPGSSRDDFMNGRASYYHGNVKVWVDERPPTIMVGGDAWELGPLSVWIRYRRRHVGSAKRIFATPSESAMLFRIKELLEENRDLHDRLHSFGS